MYFRLPLETFCFHFQSVITIYSVVDPAVGCVCVGWVGGEKHEINVAAFGSHLFYDLLYNARGAMAPSAPFDPLLYIKDLLSPLPSILA